MTRHTAPARAAGETAAQIAEGGERARALLYRNLTPHGIKAASGPDRHYHCIFGRDASICALAMALSGDGALREGAAQGLRTLARHQAANGQIPKFVDVESDEGDFWYLGCIDATLWWLIALDFLDRHAGFPLRSELEGAVARALDWLHGQEHPRLQLVQQNEASDWADLMPRSGFVLYSNALWYAVKRRYALPGAEATRHHFNHLFQPFSRDLPEYRRLRLLTHYVKRTARHRDLYLSFVNFSFFGDEGDVFGNLLAVLFGLADGAQTRRIARALEREGVSTPVPVRATCAPIRRTDPLWRPYMARHRQNLEHQYHNGGCWPFVGGVHVVALGARGMRHEAERALEALVQAHVADDWQFSEWFHGRSGKPMGMRGQSWNAAMFLLAANRLAHALF